MQLHPNASAGAERRAPLRGWPLLLLVMAICGCDGCRDKHEAVAQLDGPMPVRWMYERDFKAPHGPGAIIALKQQGAYLEVGAGAKPVRQAVPCWKPRPQLGADKAKSAVAYRCDDGEPWVLVQVGKTRALTDTGADLGKGKQPDWSRAPDFATSALRVLQSSKGGAREVYDEMHERGGDAGLAQLLIASASLPVRGNNQWVDSWDSRLQELPAGEQERVRAALLTKLAEADASHWLVRRVAATVPLDDASVRGQLADHLRRHLDGLIGETVAEPADDPPNPVLHSAIIALQRLAPKDPPAAGKLACRALKLRERCQPCAMDALAIVVHAGQPCEAVGEAIADRPLGCWATVAGCLQKDGSFEACTSEALAPIVAKVVQDAAKRKGSGYRHDQDKGVEAAVVLAAALAHGPLPQWLTKAASRLRYKLDQPGMNDKGTDGCGSPRVKAGERCRCFASGKKLRMRTSLPQTLCALEPGPPEGELLHEHCRYRVDDDERVITVLGPR